MILSRHHLTLIDLMAAVVAAALGLGWVVSVAPGRAGPALIIIGPLVGVLWDRCRGGRGHLWRDSGRGDVCGFRADHAGHWPTLARRGRSVVDGGRPVQVIIMTAICLTFGTLMGVAAWLAAAGMGRSVAPRRAEPK